jgi:hypothetical protein
MQFDPISLQKFEAITSGGILNTALVVTPPIERVERAAKALGVTYKVSAKADGSLDFSTYDLALDTALETQDYGDRRSYGVNSHNPRQQNTLSIASS